MNGDGSLLESAVVVLDGSVGDSALLTSLAWFARGGESVSVYIPRSASGGFGVPPSVNALLAAGVNVRMYRRPRDEVVLGRIVHDDPRLVAITRRSAFASPHFLRPSLVHAVARYRCPPLLLLAPPHPARADCEPKRVLVPIAERDGAEALLETIAPVARRRETEIVLLQGRERVEASASPPPPGGREQLPEPWRTRLAGTWLRPVTTERPFEAAFLEHARRDADLVALAWRPQCDMDDQRVGGLPERALADCPYPVLLQKK